MTEERSGADLQHDAAAPQPSSTRSDVQALRDKPDDPPPTPESGGGVDRHGKRTVSLSPQARDRIASQLRTLYDSVASQPVPDRFADLIARLDTTDRNS